MKIVSLVPSLTELLFDLDLGDKIVGRTKFCIHPKDKVGAIQKVGGTKNVNINIVNELDADLIIANKEENTKADIDALFQQNEVLVTNIKNYDDALEAILTIGKMTSREDESQKLVHRINTKFASIKPKKSFSVCYLIWKDPYMTIGNDTFIHDMLSRCNLNNIYKDHTRYPVVSLEDILSNQPDILMLSSEPYPFKQKHIEELQEALPKVKVILVDGEYFSWYGSRMFDAADYFNELLKTHLRS